RGKRAESLTWPECCARRRFTCASPLARRWDGDPPWVVLSPSAAFARDSTGPLRYRDASCAPDRISGAGLASPPPAAGVRSPPSGVSGVARSTMRPRPTLGRALTVGGFAHDSAGYIRRRRRLMRFATSLARFA